MAAANPDTRHPAPCPTGGVEFQEQSSAIPLPARINHQRVSVIWDKTDKKAAGCCMFVQTAGGAAPVASLNARYGGADAPESGKRIAFDPRLPASSYCRKRGVRPAKFCYKFFFAARCANRRDLLRAVALWLGLSYPLFLWITLCIRVRKHATSESGRGLRLNWLESRLFLKTI